MFLLLFYFEDIKPQFLSTNFCTPLSRLEFLAISLEIVKLFPISLLIFTILPLLLLNQLGHIHRLWPLLGISQLTARSQLLFQIFSQLFFLLRLLPFFPSLLLFVLSHILLVHAPLHLIFLIFVWLLFVFYQLLLLNVRANIEPELSFLQLPKLSFLLISLLLFLLESLALLHSLSLLSFTSSSKYSLPLLQHYDLFVVDTFCTLLFLLSVWIRHTVHIISDW